MLFLENVLVGIPLEVFLTFSLSLSLSRYRVVFPVSCVLSFKGPCE
jgi:hypothetical protein